MFLTGNGFNVFTRKSCRIFFRVPVVGDDGEEVDTAAEVDCHGVIDLHKRRL